MTRFANKDYLKSILTDIGLQEEISALFTLPNKMYSDKEMYDALRENVDEESPYYTIPFELFKEIMVRIDGKNINGVTIGKYDVNKMMNNLDAEEKSNAGFNQTVSGTSTTLSANLPSGAFGKWCILIGEGGSLSSDTDPNATFTGVQGQQYVLAWILLQSLNSMSVVVINFI